MTCRKKTFKTLLNGVIQQDSDRSTEDASSMEVKTTCSPSSAELKDLVFALKCAKHLKSNTIVLAKNNQLLGMGCGQTSRIDACKHAAEKAKLYGFELEGAVMASDAFFPFPDCVELVNKEGIKAVVQPGGSIKDQLSIDYCNENKCPWCLQAFVTSDIDDYCMYLVADIGNTRLKFSVFEGEAMVFHHVVEKNDGVVHLHHALISYKISAAILCNTSEVQSEILSLLHKLPVFIHLDHNTPIPIKNEYGAPETLGKDRLAAAVGAAKMFPRKNVLFLIWELVSP
jgi:hypothetical protein